MGDFRRFCLVFELVVLMMLGFGSICFEVWCYDFDVGGSMYDGGMSDVFDCFILVM